MTALLTWIVILVVGFSSVPFVQSWLWGPLFVIATFVVALMWYARVSAKKVRAWVNTVLVPRSQTTTINWMLFLAILSEMEAHQDGLDQRIKDMITNKDTIAEELMRLGLLLTEDASV